MDKVLGKYLNQPDNDFPLDCETFDYIQNNNFITEILGNIAGDKCFIYGCEKSGTNYASGYVFLRTTDHPEGEILPFSGGSSSGRVYINSQEVSVNANDKTYSAYTKRSLSLEPTAYDKKGYNLNEFTYASYSQPLYGEIKIWSGSVDVLPPGYHLCDGMALPISEYQNLYNIIGTMYNNQHIGTHTTYGPGDYYTTSPGYFRVPDLTARFVVGCDSTEMIPGDDINENGYLYGSQGGLSTYKLTSKQCALPSHKHSVNCNLGYSGTHYHGTFGESNDNSPYGLYSSVRKHYGSHGGMDQDNYTYRTSSDGGHTHEISVNINPVEIVNAAEAHENKPPFMVLCYIIRCC